MVWVEAASEVTNHHVSDCNTIIVLCKEGDLEEGKAHITRVAHFVKSLSAYNVKLSSTLFSGNIQSNFEISFPNARFLIQLGYNLITILLGPSGMRLFKPLNHKTEKTLFQM